MYDFDTKICINFDTTKFKNKFYYLKTMIIFTPMIYHRSIGFPDSLIIPRKKLELKYSYHALARVKQRTKKKKLPLKSIMLTFKKLVEVWTTANNKNIQLCTFKTSFKDKNDVIFVIKPNFKKSTAKVITIWLDRSDQDYRNINKSKYDTP
jgi:hypothetical protein